MKKQLKSRFYNNPFNIAAILALVIATSIVAVHSTRSVLATPREIEAAKNQIVLSVAEERLVGSCSEVSENYNLKMGKFVPNYRYIRINKHANRAIVTDCAERDELFAKTKDGIWEPTNINLELSNRANIKWLKECLIDDIVVADELIRPENSSIDSTNFEECKRINTH